MILSTATHLQPTRHILPGFGDSLGREQGSLLQGLSVLSIEKDGTGIEKNGTGIKTCRSGFSREDDPVVKTGSSIPERPIAAKAALTIEKDGTGINWEIVA